MQPSNILRIKTLSIGWLDKDAVICHACFQVLADFVEQEMLSDGWVNWDQNADTNAARIEIEKLYSWWKAWITRPESTSFDQDWIEYQEENAMLKRLIDVRMYMWT